MGNLEYTVVIEGVTMHPDGAYLDAYMVFKVPDSDKQLAFGGHGIKFSRKGGLAPGATGDLSLSDIVRDPKSFSSRHTRKAIESNCEESKKEWMMWIMRRACLKNNRSKDFQF